MILLLAVFLYGNSWLYGQPVLKGLVLDKNSRQPVISATVYINGTTKCVSTDRFGCFTIEKASPPFQLVISHLSYEPLIRTIDSIGTGPLTLLMQEKVRQLSEVTVKGKDRSNRHAYIQAFKDEFLGTDDWGNHAILRNDSDLILKIETDSDQTNPNFRYINRAGNGSFDEQYAQWEKDQRHKGANTVLSVSAKAPLIVELPLLGYTVFIQLEYFKLKKNDDQKRYITYYGYYYFKPYETNSRKDQEKIERNREKAYYNSSMHFCRSLYNDSLKQNGYLTVRMAYDDSTKRVKQRFNDILLFRDKKDTTQLRFKDLKDGSFSIYYFNDANGKPLNLADIDSKNSRSLSAISRWFNYIKSASQVSTSAITFLKDSCLIRRDGTIPENGCIKFSGQIAVKGVGAILPADYKPQR